MTAALNSPSFAYAYSRKAGTGLGPIPSEDMPNVRRAYRLVARTVPFNALERADVAASVAHDGSVTIKLTVKVAGMVAYEVVVTAERGDEGVITMDARLAERLANGNKTAIDIINAAASICENVATVSNWSLL